MNVGACECTIAKLHIEGGLDLDWKLLETDYTDHDIIYCICERVRACVNMNV